MKEQPIINIELRCQQCNNEGEILIHRPEAEVRGFEIISGEIKSRCNTSCGEEDKIHAGHICKRIKGHKGAHLAGAHSWWDQ